jgi:hypothetical protein
LEYILGSKREGEEKPKTVPERIHNIEKSLQELSAKTALLSDAQELCTDPVQLRTKTRLTVGSEQAQGHLEASAGGGRCRA